ncbi:HisA/HisF-related TIM barrel protein, partial [Akkermansiaceae bacterium]|nr:HisA/HisF-related TIM barrel protein [Akkermansiaceae bacterium]
IHFKKNSNAYKSMVIEGFKRVGDEMWPNHIGIFTIPIMVGNPVQAAKVFNSRNVDELMFLDIYATRQSRKINLHLVEKIIDECYMPVSIGGNVANLDDVKNLLRIGADKVVINSHAMSSDFINNASNEFGESTIIFSLDVKTENNGNKYIIYHDKRVLLNQRELERINKLSFGELLINSVNNDGMMKGYDLNLFKVFKKIVSRPIILCGGAGNAGHFSDVFRECEVQALAASSIFFFTQNTPNDVKKEIRAIRPNVRI